ncbi:hypothetical protein ACM614_29925 [Streptomyces sp. 12297]
MAKRFAVFASTLAVAGLVGCSGQAEPQKVAHTATTAVTPDPAKVTRAALDRASSAAIKIGSAELRGHIVREGKQRIDIDESNIWAGHGPVAVAGTMDATKAVGAAASLVDQDGKLPRRQVDGVTYYQVDKPLPGPYVGKTWFKDDLEPNRENSAGGHDVRDMLREMTELTEVKVVGKESVSSLSATHYRGLLPLDAALSAELDSAGVPGTPAAMTVDVWIDDQDLPVKMTQAVERYALSLEFTQFGKVKPIVAPPASQTVSLTEYSQGSLG